MRARLCHPLLAALLFTALASSSSAAADTSKELMKLFSEGFYDTVIARATEELRTAPGDEKFLYLRGRAYYGLQAFTQAEADLKPLGDYSPRKDWPAASATLARASALIALAPPHLREVWSADRVAFRVYYEEDDPRTRALISALPSARRTVCDFYGRDLPPIAVYIFSDAKHYDAFYGTLVTTTKDWEWLPARGYPGCLVFSLHTPAGALTFNFPDGVPSVVRHELSHTLHRRVVGRASIPTWLEEGMAEYCEALQSPPRQAWNQAQIAKFAGRWLPLDVMRKSNSFHAKGTTDQAYVQAYTMTYYLIATYGKEKTLQLFMDYLKSEKSVNAAFRKALGIDQAGFYEQWLNAPS